MGLIGRCVSDHSSRVASHAAPGSIRCNEHQVGLATGQPVIMSEVWQTGGLLRTAKQNLKEVQDSQQAWEE